MDLDWSELFRLSLSPLELIVRGTAVYWFLFAIFRLFLRRDIGSVGIADLLVLVIIADAAQNAMAGGYESISDGFVLIATLAGWNILLDWMAYRSERVRRFLQPPELLLIHRGRILHRNLRREFLSEDDLMSKLREHGVDSVAEVKSAHMESDGTVTVVPLRSKERGNGPPKQPASGASPR
jgi:uncharacterized membrane protein YcaP (DUF421 family)